MNMTEIARELGVSQSTVSRVLNNHDTGRVNPQTAERIRHYIKKNGFVRNSLASTLRTGKSNIMGLILPWNVPELMDTIERECAKRNINLLVQFTPEPDSNLEQRAVNVILQHQVDYLIWEPYVSCDINLIERAKNSVQNVVILGDHPLIQEAIRFNYTAGLQKVFQHAIENSFKNIVFIGASNDTLTYIPDSIRINNSFSLVWGERFSPAEIKNLAEPDTLFITWNDWQGIELYHTIQEYGLSIPNKIGIVVIGDLLIGNQFRIGELFRQPLTSLKRDFAAMAHAAVNCAINDKKLNQSIYVDMELIARESTARC